MAASDGPPGVMPGGGGGEVPGKAMTMEQHMLDKGAQMMQGLKPVKQMKQHICTFALYAHDLSRQIETHHYATRINQDFLQCAVYDSDNSKARLIGVEYIVSDRVFDALPPEEQKLWHSHAHEIKTGLWVNPRVPEMIQKSELQDLVNSYGKFWCTWQVDRGDPLPLGAPSLMMSPQGEVGGVVEAELVQKRDSKYNICTGKIMSSRADIVEPTNPNPHADHWKRTGKGFAVEFEPTEMKKKAPSP